MHFVASFPVQVNIADTVVTSTPVAAQTIEAAHCLTSSGSNIHAIQ